MKTLYLYISLMALMAGLFSCKRANVRSVEKTPTGILITLDQGILQVDVVSSRVIHVRQSPTGNLWDRKSLMVVEPVKHNILFTVGDSAGCIVLKTDDVSVQVDKKTSAIAYYDKSGNRITGELQENPREITPATVVGENTWNVSLSLKLAQDEAIYGLGQTQTGYMNLRNDSLELFQKNKEDYIPVIVSTNGYGILWDNYSYTLFKDNAKGMNLWSEVGDGIDYYFMYGPDLDKVIANYRDLTGGCPMLPKWAFGYVQSKERYKTQDEILGIVKQYRQRQIPLDVIVEDWQYWPQGQWGQKSFDPARFPNPLKMLDELHNKYHAKFMISIWGVMTMGFPNSNEIFNTPGSNYYRIRPDEIYYDPFNAVSANLYWKHCNEGLFSKGVDAWWCDATEPEIDRVFIISADSVRKKMTTSMGSGARYMCAYPLMHSKNMYENQRKTTSEKRVVNLTRSGFGGQQRYSTIVWSGDVLATWDVFKKQIPAGLNFCSTGIPYWTTDIGAFFITPRGDDGGFPMGIMDDEYKELYLRWFQFGAFCPMFRSHGTDFPREVWRFGEPGTWCFDALLKMDQLRYRLLPYIYSVGWMTTHNGYTMMRPLAFDFRADKNVYDIDDQYMFGPAFLVNPVTSTHYHKSDGNSQIIPSSALFVNGKNGLKGEYFNGLNFEKKISERIDTAINFTWNKNPLQGVNEERFSVRWTGQILIKEGGEYTFITANDDGTRLWVDNKLIIDDWNNHGTEVKNGKITLKANTRYTIRLEYYDNVYDAVIRLSWFPPQKQQEIDTKSVQSRQVYLPANTQWYDFWTGENLTGGGTIDAPAPLDQIPLYIKAGSIIPLGPIMQYSTEEPADPLELRIYTGADGDFTLYEDENDNYNYEQGKYATIPFNWDEQTQTLTIGERKGKFPGMLAKRTFQIVFVGKGHGCGMEPTQKADRQITYAGDTITIIK